jgi:hypothetical protein
MLKQLSQEDLSKFANQEAKLPTKDERKKAKEDQERVEQMAKEIKAKLEKFLIDEILPSDIPVNLADEIPELLKSLIKIYYTGSAEWQEFLTARKKVYETAFKDLTPKNE